MSTAPILKGIATIVWGTGVGNANNGAPNGAIVESINVTPKNGEPVDIEDGAGLTAALVILDDGFSAKVSCVDDSAKAWPSVGSNTTLSLPGRSGNANASGAAYTCLVCPYDVTQTRKKEGMVTINLLYRPNVAV